MSTTEQQWAKAVEIFRAAALADGYRESTVARVAKEVASFSRSTRFGPWDVDAVTVEAWTERDELSAQRGYVLRTSLRTFYRWAHRVGYVQTDPTAYVSKALRPRTTPDEWVPAVEAYRRYLRTAQASPNTILLRMQQLARIAEELPVRDPWDVTAEDLITWLAGHRWARETARQWRTTLRSFYSWGQMIGHIGHNPALSIPRVSTRPPLPRPASEVAYADALARCDARTALMVRLAAEMGLRRAEVAQVNSRDLIKAEDGWWLEVFGKGAKVRTLPVPADLATALLQLGPGYAFPGQMDGHLSPRYVGKLVADVLPAEVTMHQLRHRFATKAYAVDCDLFTVQELLGHATPTTTRAYVAIPRSNLRRLVDRVAG